MDGGKRDEGGYDHAGNGGDHGSHDYRDYGYGNMGSGSGAGVPGLGAWAHFACARTRLLKILPKAASHLDLKKNKKWNFCLPEDCKSSAADFLFQNSVK